jgi:hypothetical protein
MRALSLCSNRLGKRDGIGDAAMLVHLHFNSPEWWLKLIYSEQVEYSRQTG